LFFNIFRQAASELKEADRTARLKRHFANTYLSSSKGGSRKTERKDRLHAVTSIYVASMVIPTFLVELKENWCGIAGSGELKIKHAGMLKGCYNAVTQESDVLLELYESFRNVFAYYKFTCLLVNEVVNVCHVREKKREKQK
jgi:hypothetical protein